MLLRREPVFANPIPENPVTVKKVTANIFICCGLIDAVVLTVDFNLELFMTDQ